MNRTKYMNTFSDDSSGDQKQEEIVDDLGDKRFGFEEVTYLLLFGKLPTPEQRQNFIRILTDLEELSGAFIRDVIMKATSANLMNSLMKSILSLYSYDENPDDTSVPNVLRQSLQLISAAKTFEGNCCFPELTDELSDNLKFLDVHIGNLKEINEVDLSDSIDDLTEVLQDGRDAVLFDRSRWFNDTKKGA